MLTWLPTCVYTPMATTGKKKQRGRVRVHGGEDQSSVRVLYSEDGRRLFVCSGCKVKVFSTSSRAVVHSLTHHTAKVTACCINPANTMQLLTASLDGKVLIWDCTDGALLRELDFGVPLFRFAIRPGKKEPRVFFEVEKGTMEVDPNEGLELGAQGTDKVVVGVASSVITDRQPAVALGNQLAQAKECLHLGTVPKDFCFTSDGWYVVSFKDDSLLVYSIETERLGKLRSQYPITAVTCHPTEHCIATGNENGEIHLWWNWSPGTGHPTATKLHWHAHAVSDMCFTTDGTHLLSGGEEGVMVVWQLATHKSFFRPRLGSQITRVACGSQDHSFAISLRNNTIVMISGLDNEVQFSLGGLRKAHTQNPRENGARTGLQWDPRSQSIVLNANPGMLQWYAPEKDIIISQLDVTGLNYVSRTDKPFILTMVERAAFSSDGRWLATVEWRDDGKTTPELRLKFWEFISTEQKFVLNTCVEPPHDAEITSLTFQPHPRSTKSAAPLAVTTSKDRKFKSWALVDSKRGSANMEASMSWACRSVGYYHSLPCRRAAFCEDGSLLAVNFKKFITLWDPYSCNMRRAFSCPFPSESFVQHAFGYQASSHYLLAASSHHLMVWDLLRCSVLWSVAVDVGLLVSDHFGPLAAAFVPSREGTTHLYIFNPASPTPLSVWGSVCTERVSSALYVPSDRQRQEGVESASGGDLFFLTKSQVLFVMTDEEDIPSARPATLDSLSEDRGEETARRAFFEIFGDGRKGEVEFPTGPVKPRPLRSKHKPKVFDAAPHVLPPMSLLSQPFLQSLLPPSKEGESSGGGGGERELSESESKEGEDEEGEDEEGEDEEEEEEEGESSDSDGAGRDADTSSHKMVEGGASSTTPAAVDTGFTVGTYDWLTKHHFTEITMQSQS